MLSNRVQLLARKVTRASSEITYKESRSKSSSSACNVDQDSDQDHAPPPTTHVVGWPPIRSYRKNCLQAKKTEVDGVGTYVKVSMDGAPYLRKIDLKVYRSYPDLLKALENIFKLTIGEYSEREGYNGSEYVPTYEDKDGDWCR